jgi:uroporphyrinogen decarboxylase
MAEARPAHLLIRAARGEAVERPPVWAMRQAGRWDPEFRKLRAGLGFFEFSEQVELAAQATLCPRRFGVDAIILFYDITTLTIAMGLPFTLQEARGPVPDQPVRTLADVQRLDPHPPPESYQHIRDLLRLVRDELRGELPAIYFAGAPFTLASYCIGTGKDIAATLRFAAEQPAVWHELLERICLATIDFLNTLADDGGELYQLFDSWAGELSPADYARYAQAYHQRIFAAANRVPRVLFVKECPYLEAMTQSGADVISLGVRHDLAAARRQYPHLVFQGNVDENLLRSGTIEQIRAATQACLAAGGGHRHIVNLSHGVDRDTPPDHFAAYVQAARAGL